jgi:L-threonylcarbamoyladenylate synthase
MEYAQGLYAALRKLDAEGLDQIIVEALPDSQDWAAVADRLQRATAAHALVDSSGR